MNNLLWRNIKFYRFILYWYSEYQTRKHLEFAIRMSWVKKEDWINSTIMRYSPFENAKFVHGYSKIKFNKFFFNQ